MCMEEFSRVSRTNEFMELDAAHVHEMLACDDLLANSEVSLQDLGPGMSLWRLMPRTCKVLECNDAATLSPTEETLDTK